MPGEYNDGGRDNSGRSTTAGDDNGAQSTVTAEHHNGGRDNSGRSTTMGEQLGRQADGMARGAFGCDLF
jgi:hypothetical protein